MAIYQGSKLLGQGARGKSAYDYAVEGGYAGTEEHFKEEIAKAPDLYDLVQKLSAQINGFTIGKETVNGVDVITFSYDDGQ